MGRGDVSLSTAPSDQLWRPTDYRLCIVSTWQLAAAATAVDARVSLVGNASAANSGIVIVASIDAAFDFVDSDGNDGDRCLDLFSFAADASRRSHLGRGPRHRPSSILVRLTILVMLFYCLGMHVAWWYQSLRWERDRGTEVEIPTDCRVDTAEQAHETLRPRLARGTQQGVTMATLVTCHLLHAERVAGFVVVNSTDRSSSLSTILISIQSVSPGITDRTRSAHSISVHA